ncbi:hypothetical protein B0F90DRAFT_1684486 [Multifurca ochricompacta]|uniref:Uncharacterized protein n=1 Tax=Multifurca ochricompacta TaxID=376703 RepID=A0AAD4MDE5_9AGAM|nr:hypothetical protein B0F90DRAFT_1684486 [Multifurca ochricompacta]
MLFKCTIITAKWLSIRPLTLLSKGSKEGWSGSVRGGHIFLLLLFSPCPEASTSNFILIERGKTCDHFTLKDLYGHNKRQRYTFRTGTDYD